MLGFYRKALTVVFVALFFTNLADYTLRYGIAPLDWIALMLALTLPLVPAALTRAGWRLPVIPLAMWGVAYIVISIVWFFPSAQVAKNFGEVRTRMLSVIVVMLVLFLVSRAEEQRLARVAIAWASMVAVGFNLYELFNPLTFSSIPGRSQGLYANVNQSGAALVLGLIVAYHVVPTKLRVPFVLLDGVGLLTTFSRAAIMGWILTLLLFGIRSAKGGGLALRDVRRMLFVAGMVVAFIFSPLWTNLTTTLEQRGVLTMDVMARLSFFSKGSTSDDSANERRVVARKSWTLFEEAPLDGYGTGAANLPPLTLGTHNIYLRLMVDHGILGVFILPSMLATMLWGVRRSNDIGPPVAAFILLWGFFSHNVLEERYILLTVAVVAASVATERRPVAEVESIPISASPAPGLGLAT